MNYKFSVEGMDKIGKMLKELGSQADIVASSGLYDGAGVMADEIHAETEHIKTAPFHYAVFVQRDPSPEEAAIVQNANAGIAKFQKTGTEVNTSVGFRNAGYAILAGKRKPIPVIVNAINSGTSFMRKQPFFRRAVTRATPKAEAAIVETIEKKFNRIIQNNGG